MVWIMLAATLMATPDDQASIRTARTAQNAAIASGDLERVASFWTEDVTVRRALGQRVIGREAARKGLETRRRPRCT